MNCKFCNKQHDGTYASGTFCSKRCAAKYAHIKINWSKLKTVNCKRCQKEIQVKIGSSPNGCLCMECKTTRKCNQCGQTPCKRPDICNRFKVFPGLNTYFGFDLSKVGSTEVYEEFQRIQNIVLEDYLDNKLSIPDMAKKYNHNNIRNFSKILNSLGLETRNLSESSTLAMLQGKKHPQSCHVYKHGWHTTWNDKKVFYRSSYELDYIQILDSQKINYEVEALRLLYWDSIQNIQRVAIPDIFLPDTNTIIEIKSDYTYDVQNMKDRIKSYKEHGYNFKLILEKKEVIGPLE